MKMFVLKQKIAIVQINWRRRINGNQTVGDTGE